MFLLRRELHAEDEVEELDRILERGPEKFISASEVIRAVKALACLSGESRWVEPPRTVIHIHTGDKCPEPLRDSGSARPA